MNPQHRLPAAVVLAARTRHRTTAPYVMVRDEATVTTRVVHCGDGLAWLRSNPLPADHSILTSLPDSSELSSLGFEGWRAWFSDTCALICSSVAPGACAIFFQTDVKRDGRWVDKGYLVQRGAEAAGSAR